MTVARLVNLKQTTSFPGANHAHVNRNVKTLAQMFSQFLSEFDHASGDEIDGLAHARFTHIGINGLCAEYHCIVASAQELEHGLMDRRQEQLFAHGKLLECQGSGVEHCLKGYACPGDSSKI